MTETLLTKKELAAKLKISVRTLERLIKDGKINPIRIGHLVRFHPNVLESIN